MPLLTPDQDALANGLCGKAMQAIGANDLGVLKECLGDYGAARQNVTVDAFWSSYQIGFDDPFVSGETYDEEEDTRFYEVVMAVLDPPGLHSPVQVDMAHTLKSFVIDCSRNVANGHDTREWDNVLGELMNRPDYERYDLIKAWLEIDSAGEAANRSLKDQTFFTTRSLYNWMLVTCALFDDDWNGVTRSWSTGNGPFIPGMENDDLTIQANSQNYWLQSHVLPKVHALLPLHSPDNEGFVSSPTYYVFPTYEGDSLPFGEIPLTVAKCQALLTILAHKLEAKTKIEAYVTPLRARGRRARVNQYIFLFYCLINGKALIRLMHRPTDVRILRDKNDALIGTTGVVPTAMLAEYHNDGF